MLCIRPESEATLFQVLIVSVSNIKIAESVSKKREYPSLSLVPEYTRPTQTVLRGMIRVKHLRVFDLLVRRQRAGALLPCASAWYRACAALCSGPPPSASAWYRASAAFASVLRLGLRPPRLRLATLPCTARRRPVARPEPLTRVSVQHSRDQRLFVQSTNRSRQEVRT